MSGGLPGMVNLTVGNPCLWATPVVSEEAMMMCKHVRIFGVVLCGALILGIQPLSAQKLNSSSNNDSRALFGDEGTEQEDAGQTGYFVTTKEDFIKGLSVTPPAEASSLKPMGRTKGFTARGLGGIVTDSSGEGLLEAEDLEKLPTIGALILFDYNSDVIKAESKDQLRQYAEALENELKDVKLVIAGHTDSKGSEVYNLNLSKRRAEAVRTFLLSECDINETRLIAYPFGEDKPIETNETAEGRSLNRRVEFIRVQ